VIIQVVAELVTINKNMVEVKRIGAKPGRFEKLARPTSLQQRAFDLLWIKLVAQTGSQWSYILFVRQIDVLSLLFDRTSG
jgi:hypothetical protein